MTQRELPPVISSGVYSWLLDYELLLFSVRAGELFHLNPSAALIWTCVEEGLDRDAIVAELAETFSVPATRAEQDVNSALKQWARLELLGCTGPVVPAAIEEPDEPSHLDEIPEPASPIDAYLGERRYRMLETVVRIRFRTTSMCEIGDSVFGHLRVADDQPFDFTLDVHRDTAGYFLFRDDQLCAYGASEQEVAPLLHGAVVSEAYANADCLLAIHAAAVSNGHECIVFPATSGSGKTTLTAALIGTGLKYATDELVLLQHRSHEVQAIAAGLGIKPGSWSIVQEFHPILGQLPTGLRQDGQNVRYLLPQETVMPEDPAQYYRLRALVFPTYHAEAETMLDTVSAAQALCLLTDAGSDMEGGLDRERVAELVEWIRGIRCYTLRYSDLREAAAIVSDLLA